MHTVNNSFFMKKEDCPKNKYKILANYEQSTLLIQIVKGHKDGGK